jgi:hypothetical protein
MGSVPRASGPVIWRDNRYFDRGPSFGIGRPYSPCYGSVWCGIPRRSGYGYGGYGYGSYGYGRGFGFHNVYSYRVIYIGIPHVHYYFSYAIPVYPPGNFWAPQPAKIWNPAAPPDTTPAAPDPAKSRMLTIGEGTDGGGGVMRIETLNDSVTRVTWLGTSRPIREARLYLADSAQRSLRSALVDADAPSALFKLADVATRVRYAGLTITFASGAIETTLIPYDPRAKRQP